MKGIIFLLDTAIFLLLLVSLYLFVGNFLNAINLESFARRIILSYRDAERAAILTLFAPSPWRCVSPSNIPVPGCVTRAISEDNLGLSACWSSDPIILCNDSPSDTVLYQDMNVCVGDWNNCNETSVRLGVWT